MTQQVSARNGREEGMARIVAGMASSHALALTPPDQWDLRRQVTRQNYERRYGVLPPERPEIDGETPEANAERHQRLYGALERLRERIDQLRLDTIVLVGDDQDENFREDNLPQFAIYTGEAVKIEPRRGSHAPTIRGEVDGAVWYPCDSALARAIHEGMVEAEFDLASCARFPEDRLLSHAHTQVLSYMGLLASPVPMVPIFVNAIHVPAPTPARCYRFGVALRRVLERDPDDRRVLVYASGGLSHYTAGFPWPHYQGQATLGYVDVEFDRRVVGWMQEGHGSRVQTLTNRDLLDSGNIEMRQWFVLMGVLGDGVPPVELVYEPFFRGIMGMAAGYWELERQAPTV